MTHTPTVMLKGKWLSEFGFDIGTHVKVECEDGRLIITKEEAMEEIVQPVLCVAEGNAKKCADANPGYSVFDVNGVNIYTPNTTSDSTAAIPFLVKVSISDLNIRKGPGTDYARTQYIPVGVYTIVEVKSGKGSTAG